jgi:hypothetical protein
MNLVALHNTCCEPVDERALLMVGLGETPMWHTRSPCGLQESWVMAQVCQYLMHGLGFSWSTWSSHVHSKATCVADMLYSYVVMVVCQVFPLPCTAAAVL